MGRVEGGCLRASLSSDSLGGHSDCVGKRRKHRIKSSKSTVHLWGKQLGGLGKESKSPSAHLSSNLAANLEAVAPNHLGEQCLSTGQTISNKDSSTVIVVHESTTATEAHQNKPSINGSLSGLLNFSLNVEEGLRENLSSGLLPHNLAIPSWTCFQQNLAVKKFLTHIVALQFFHSLVSSGPCICI